MENYETLKSALADLKSVEPKLRNLDLAKRLGISEAELILLSLSENVIRLNGDCKGLLKQMQYLGYVMALTRNEHCVHERKGIYENIEFYESHGNMGVAVNPDIDLRFFMNEWEYAFAIVMPRGNSKLYGFQFFNKRGEAVHKIYTTPKSDIDAFWKIVEDFKDEQTTEIEIDKSEIEAKKELNDTEINVDAFQNTWKNLTDTHQFFGMLRKYEVSRTQAFRLAPEGFTQQVPKDTVVEVLQAAAENETSIMCFLHSKGCVQIHTGKVKNLLFHGSWYNVMDPKFNLHLNMESVDTAWIVKKPTDDGIVTSLELFDKDGELITYFFGARKPGVPELEAWRTIIENVAIQHV